MVCEMMGMCSCKCVSINYCRQTHSYGDGKAVFVLLHNPSFQGSHMSTFGSGPTMSYHSYMVSTRAVATELAGYMS